MVGGWWLVVGGWRALAISAAVTRKVPRVSVAAILYFRQASDAY